MSTDNNKETVLIVDDIGENIDVLTGLLQKEYNLKFATNGKKAINITRRFLPDIILLDIVMPGLDGFEVTEILKADPLTQDIPIIFVTARNEDFDEAKGFELGAVDYITKPIKPIVLKGRIRTQLALSNQNKILDIKVRERTMTLNAAFEASPVPLLILDEKINIVLANTATAVLCGGDLSDVLQHRLGNALNCVHSTEDPHGCGYSPDCSSCPACNAIESLFKNGGSIHGVEMVLDLVRHAKTNKVWVVLSAEPVMINGRRHLCVAMEDITKRKRVEEEKRKTDAYMNQQQRLESIGILASGVAHEINNPLNGIMNYSQLILDSLDTDSKNAEFAKEILSETNRITSIVKNLLQFSRNEKQEHSYANIKDIIDSTLTLINTVIKHDQIDLQIDVPEDLPALKCRSQQIQQVIMNLMTNARDALNEKFEGYHEDKIIKLHCKQFNREDRIWIRITVEDHGNGIPEDIKEKIFDPFFTSKNKDKGTGLGLSISHGIIKEHCGELTFESKEGKHTKFYMDLPIDNEWELEN
ncbi:MAG: response regulator [Clostridiales bacterium]|nr:response regulator [Clostridiales bacterium]